MTFFSVFDILGWQCFLSKRKFYMKAILYIRVSTKSQHAGVSIQISVCTEKASSLGIKDTRTFIDSDVAHDVPLEQRPGLSKALNSLNCGDVFISTNQDRISRSTILKVRFFHILQKLGVQFISTLEDTDMTLAQGHKITRLYTENSIEYPIARTQEVATYKKAQEEITGTVPYGFKRIESGARLVSCPEEQKVIATARKLHASGYSLRAIQQQLSIAGTRTRKGTEHQLTQIARILKSYAKEEQNKPRGKRTLPYGFKYNGAKIEQCPNEQQIVNLAKHLRSQNLTLSKITDMLNKLGYRGRTGNPFGISQTSRMLKRTSSLPQKGPGTVPYGFMFCPAKKSIELDSKEQEIIAHAQALRAQGYSLKAVAHKLNQLGYKSRNNTLFMPAQAAKMVSQVKPVPITKPVGPSNLPYGYKYVDQTLQTEYCSQEQKVITLAIELQAQGLSLRQIAREINLRGYRTRAGTFFYISQIARMLKRHTPLTTRSSHENPQSTL
jgi:DNA invertase Pin-like site-specific DNA recombinase